MRVVLASVVLCLVGVATYAGPPRPPAPLLAAEDCPHESERHSLECFWDGVATGSGVASECVALPHGRRPRCETMKVTLYSTGRLRGLRARIYQVAFERKDGSLLKVYSLLAPKVNSHLCHTTVYGASTSVAHDGAPDQVRCEGSAKQCPGKTFQDVAKAWGYTGKVPRD